MSRIRLVITFTVCLSVCLLFQGAPLKGADCGLSLPCEDSANDPNYALSITNNGAGTGIFAETNSDNPLCAGVVGFSGGSSPGVYGWGNNGIGVRGHGVSHGVLGTTPSKNACGVRGENSGIGTGVYGFGYKGVYGEVPVSTGATIGIGVFGKGVAQNSIGVSGFNNAGTGVKGFSNTGKAGHFHITNNSNTSEALLVETAGTGSAGYFKVTNPENTSDGLFVKMQGDGRGAYVRIANADSTRTAIRGETSGPGWAGYFRATHDNGRGVYIETNGGQGLQVEGGTKEAVVLTSKGRRSLYAEESSEVYFSDYGFGKLKSGKVVIPIDPLFAETVNLDRDYYVFLQPYGDAELFVSRTTPQEFEVCLRGGDGNVKFAYRLVGKRRGFEQARLEPALADEHPGKKMEEVAKAKAE
jgi:hypothetical protein